MLPSRNDPPTVSTAPPAPAGTTATGAALLASTGLLFDNNPQPMWLVARDTLAFLAVNDAAVRAYGYSREEFLRMTLDDLRPVEAAAGDGGPAVQLQTRHRKKDGALMDVEVRSHPVAIGDTGAYLWLIYDITARRRATEQEARLRAAIETAARDWTLTFDAVPAAILLLDGDGRIERVNRHAGLVANKPFRELLGASVASIGTGRLWQEAARLAEVVRDTGAPQVDRTADDAGKTWLLSAHPMTTADTGHRLILMARDVSHLTRLQDALRKSETMSALGALVAGVAHEVRNPLFAISATVDAFEARFGSEGQTARYILALRQEVQRLGKVMQGLLDYGKPPQLELVETPLGAVVREAIDRCRTLAQEHAVDVTGNLPDSLPTIRVDPNRLGQAFLNLIENAVQHSPRGGVVSVRAAAVRDRSGRWIEISIADAGPGFRPEDVPHLFEPFFSRRRGGTGLGLSIVHRIVEQHGGHVVAGNRPEGGAVTTVRLALAGHLARPAPETARAET